MIRILNGSYIIVNCENVTRIPDFTFYFDTNIIHIITRTSIKIKLILCQYLISLQIHLSLQLHQAEFV